MRVFITFLILLAYNSLFYGQEKSEIVKAAVTFHFLSKDVEGTLSGFNSTSKIDLVAPENSVFKGSVDVATIKSGIFLRDWSLKGSKYFDAEKYPKITFESNSIINKGDGFQAKGILTIKGVSKTVTIDFKKQGNLIIGTMFLYSSDYGIHIKKSREDNKVDVKLLLTLE